MFQGSVGKFLDRIDNLDGVPFVSQCCVTWTSEENGADLTWICLVMVILTDSKPWDSSPFFTIWGIFFHVQPPNKQI